MEEIEGILVVGGEGYIFIVVRVEFSFDFKVGGFFFLR